MRHRVPGYWQKRAAGSFWPVRAPSRADESGPESSGLRWLCRRPARLLLWLLLSVNGWDWLILLHHLPHQSLTWDPEDDKSESLMWSKVSGSESVWVNTKGLLFPFFFQPSSLSRLRRLLPLSLSRPPDAPIATARPSADILLQCVDRAGFVN